MLNSALKVALTKTGPWYMGKPCVFRLVAAFRPKWKILDYLVDRGRPHHEHYRDEPKVQVEFSPESQHERPRPPW